MNELANWVPRPTQAGTGHPYDPSFEGLGQIRPCIHDGGQVGVGLIDVVWREFGVSEAATMQIFAR